MNKKKSVILDIQKQANCFHEYHISISTSTHDNLEFYTNSKHMIYLYVTICFNSSIDNDGRRTTNMNWFSHIVDVIYAHVSDLMKLYWGIEIETRNFFECVSWNTSSKNDEMEL